MFEWVADDQRLSELAKQWLLEPAIALDTEFIRTRTFYPEVGLIQIADQQGVYLIDPLAIEQTQPLREVLTNESVVKVLHSCSEDLEVFQRYLGEVPSPLFDTQVAAGFLGLGPSLGYANLIEQLQNEVIPKQETRSDWLQRPLSDAQLHYAALDVSHLLTAYGQLNQQLSQQSRLDWLQADCAAMIENSKQAFANSEFRDYYLRVKSAWKLKSPQLAVLQELCAWREQEARDKNVPRNRLVKDLTLWWMAQNQPKNIKSLRQAKEMHPRFLQKYGEHCLGLIQKGLEQEHYPERLPKPLDPEQTKLFKDLKSRAVSIAESMDVPPEYLIRKKELEQLVRQADSSDIIIPEALLGWRQPIIAQPLVNDLVNYQA